MFTAQVQYDPSLSATVLKLLCFSSCDIPRLSTALRCFIALSFTLGFPAVLRVFLFTVMASQGTKCFHCDCAAYYFSCVKAN